MTGKCNVTISIGRNVADTQLSPSRWDDFTDHIRDLAQGIIHYSENASVVQAGYVTGFWEGEAEESYTITVAGAEPGRILYEEETGEQCDFTLRAYFEARLARAAKFYGQECVACSWYEVGIIDAA